MSDWLRRIATLEPARLRAVWAAVIAVAVTLGVTISADVDRRVQARIVAVAALVPRFQGGTPRRTGTPGAKINAEVDTLTAAAEEREWLADGAGDDMIDLAGE